MSAPTIDEITLAGGPEPWVALGFLATGEGCQIGGVRMRFAGSSADAAAGILDWSLRELAGAELDGLPTRSSQRPAAPAAPVHPNGVSAVDHVVAMTPDLDRTVAALQAAGLDLRRVREQPTPAGAPRQAFFRLGHEILEVVQEPPEAVERRGGSGRPAQFWGLALLTEDIERTAAAFAPHAGEVRPAVQAGRRIATVRRSAGLPVPVALMSPDERPGEEPRGREPAVAVPTPAGGDRAPGGAPR
jgi:hypothetical protein